MAETGAILKGEEVVQRNLRAVKSAVDEHMFGKALEGALRLIVNEAKSQTRPGAWKDQTGNLRASISFQIENVVGPKPFVGHHADERPRTFNAVPYRSGFAAGKGEHGVVFAPPDYALPLEFKRGYSVLGDPLNTVKHQLRGEIQDGARSAWDGFVLRRNMRGGR